MWATWPGATAGFISMTTGPLVVSSVSVLPSALMRLSLFGIRGEPDGDDLVGVLHGAVVALRSGLDLVDHIHPGDHFPEHGVVAVQRRRVVEADEELRV